MKMSSIFCADCDLWSKKHQHDLRLWRDWPHWVNSIEFSTNDVTIIRNSWWSTPAADCRSSNKCSNLALIPSKQYHDDDRTGFLFIISHHHRSYGKIIELSIQTGSKCSRNVMHGIYVIHSIKFTMILWNSIAASLASALRIVLGRRS